MLNRQLLHLQHQAAGNALTASIRVHHQLHHLRPVAAVIRHIQQQLHRTDHPSGISISGHQQQPFLPFNSRQQTVPERLRLLNAKRHDKTDARPLRDAGMQHRRQFRDRTLYRTDVQLLYLNHDYGLQITRV
ncbi:hypothetical protein D3C80_1509380 [compost metagenome]